MTRRAPDANSRRAFSRTSRTRTPEACLLYLYLRRIFPADTLLLSYNNWAALVLLTTTYLASRDCVKRNLYLPT